MDRALKSFSPRPVPPRAGSNVGRAAVVILCVCVVVVVGFYMLVDLLLDHVHEMAARAEIGIFFFFGYFFFLSLSSSLSRVVCVAQTKQQIKAQQ